MKFSKFVSGVASLAIAAGAFAGFAVTASANTALKTIDFDNTSFSTSTTSSTNSKKSAYTMESVDSTETDTPAMYAADAGKVWKMNSSGNTGDATLDYAATLNDTPYTGAVNLTFKVEAIRANTTDAKDHKMQIQFADSDNTPVLAAYIPTGTRTTGNKSGLKVGTSISNYEGTDTHASCFGSLITVSADMNFYNQTETATLTDGTNTSTITNQEITAKNLAGLYASGLTYVYGNIYIDDIVIEKIDGAATTFTVTDSDGKAVESADVTIGAVTEQTDSNGQVTFELPVSTTSYSYSVTKDGCGSTDTSTGTVTVSDTNAISVSAALNTKATLKDVTVNYYITGTTDAVPTLSANKIENVAVDDTLDKSDVVKSESVVSDGKRYVYNSTKSTVLPYKVIDGDNEITIYYDVEYSASITSEPNATVTILDADKNTVGTAYTLGGTATYSYLPTGTYTAKVEKSGYTSKSETLTISATGDNSATIYLTPSTSGVLFYDDYSSAGLATSSGYGLFGAQRYYSTNVLAAWATDTASLHGITGYDGYRIQLASLAAFTQSSNTRTRESSVAFMSGDTVVFKITSNAAGSTEVTSTLSTSADSVSLTDLGAVDLVIANGQLTGTVGTQKISLSAADSVSAIDSIAFTTTSEDSYLTLSIGAITISGYTVSTDVSATYYGTYEGEGTYAGTYASAFTAALENVSGSVSSVAVKSGDTTVTKTSGTDYTSPVLTDTDTVIGIIVDNLDATAGAAATVTLTIE